MGRYFGTDGIRASTEAEVLQPPFLKRLGRAAVAFASAGDPLRIVIGRDPRASGKGIVEVLSAIWVESGVEVFDCGIAPTPAIALAVKAADADLGVVVTASHNPAQDNGIKFFSRSGTKLSEAEEARLEGLIETACEDPLSSAGSCQLYPAAQRYESFAMGQVGPNILKGRTIVLDCAHGATAKTTPSVLRTLGADLVLIGDAPDGKNINAGVGSEHPEVLAAKVVESGADLGIAHDGDGDRVLFVDEMGGVVHGDAVLALIGQHMISERTLKDNTLVATVMSNLGLDRAIETRGGRVLRTPVGDRQVFYKMLEGDYSFGGESSGHLILRSHLETGDGLTAALAFLQAWLATGSSMSAFAASIPFFPQRTLNLYVDAKTPFEEMPAFMKGLSSIETELGTGGRILVRYSGTENKVRLLAEAEDESVADLTISRLEDLVKTYLVLTK